MKPITLRTAKTESTGEVLLATMADHLERGKLPPEEAIKQFCAAVDAMLAGSDADLRRLALVRALGLVRADRERHVSTEPARLYWLLRLNDGLGKEAARERVAEQLDIDPRTVANTVIKYPEIEQWARDILTLQGK